MWLSTIKIRHCAVSFEWDVEKCWAQHSFARAQEKAEPLQEERAQPGMAVPRRKGAASEGARCKKSGASTELTWER